MGNRSLDEFLDTGDEEPADATADTTGEAAGDALSPAVSTCEWTPEGADCAACGATVERRWRDDGELVCADCKAW